VNQFPTIASRDLTFCFKANIYELIFKQTYGMFGAHPEERFTWYGNQSFSSS